MAPVATAGSATVTVPSAKITSPHYGGGACLALLGCAAEVGAAKQPRALTEAKVRTIEALKARGD